MGVLLSELQYLVNFPIIGRAPYCFKIQGQVYYQINEDLYRLENENLQYGQLFIVDPQEAVDYRMAEIMDNLEQMFIECNVICHFRHVRSRVFSQCQVGVL